MENTKDIQRTDTLGKFLDHNPASANPFGHNRIGERAYRRAERLSSALVLLTNHVPESDPIRVKARMLSLSLLSAILDVRDEMRSSSSRKFVEFQVVVRNLISVTRILAVAGHVSIQNAEVVTEALEGLVEFIQASYKTNLLDAVVIVRDDLTDVRDISIKDVRGYRRYKDEPRMASPSVESDNNHGSYATSAMSNISSRAQSVLEVLKSGSNLGIRDVAAHLPEYSEKMIQRELAELVRLGRVRKEGLKRWSKYFAL